MCIIMYPKVNDCGQRKKNKNRMVFSSSIFWRPQHRTMSVYFQFSSKMDWYWSPPYLVMRHCWCWSVRIMRYVGFVRIEYAKYKQQTTIDVMTLKYAIRAIDEWTVNTHYLWVKILMKGGSNEMMNISLPHLVCASSDVLFHFDSSYCIHLFVICSTRKLECAHWHGPIIGLLSMRTPLYGKRWSAVFLGLLENIASRLLSLIYAKHWS